MVWFFISEEGEVLDSRIFKSSGYVEIDQAALDVAGIYEFTPALNRDQKIRVWIQLPVTFQVR
jgi:protein TonB